MTTADIQRIMRALPHRHPFLLVDRVLEFEKDERIVALKNVTINEPQFAGHFPDYPVMPGVLLLEAMAQACGVLMFLSSGLEEMPPNDYMLLVGVDSCRFRRIVSPGDQLRLHGAMGRRKRNITRFATRAEVDGVVACEAELVCAHQRG